mmetsp:Transcript_31706/g.75301  ORF Transcript_31706/g.75301 Transcript_31706/m.75301 type:complete len:534 (-) Transcript_31706:323-1924(-)
MGSSVCRGDRRPLKRMLSTFLRARCGASCPATRSAPPEDRAGSPSICTPPSPLSREGRSRRALLDAGAAVLLHHDVDEVKALRHEGAVLPDEEHRALRQTPEDRGDGAAPLVVEVLKDLVEDEEVALKDAPRGGQPHKPKAERKGETAALAAAELPEGSLHDIAVSQAHADSLGDMLGLLRLPATAPRLHRRDGEGEGAADGLEEAGGETLQLCEGALQDKGGDAGAPKGLIDGLEVLHLLGDRARLRLPSRQVRAALPEELLEPLDLHRVWVACRPHDRRFLLAGGEVPATEVELLHALLPDPQRLAEAVVKGAETVLAACGRDEGEGAECQLDLRCGTTEKLLDDCSLRLPLELRPLSAQRLPELLRLRPLELLERLSELRPAGEPLLQRRPRVLQLCRSAVRSRLGRGGPLLRRCRRRHRDVEIALETAQVPLEDVPVDRLVASVADEAPGCRAVAATWRPIGERQQAEAVVGLERRPRDALRGYESRERLLLSPELALQLVVFLVEDLRLLLELLLASGLLVELHPQLT